jgi:hypothetical protein
MCEPASLISLIPHGSLLLLPCVMVCYGVACHQERRYCLVSDGHDRHQLTEKAFLLPFTMRKRLGQFCQQDEAEMERLRRPEAPVPSHTTRSPRKAFTSSVTKLTIGEATFMTGADGYEAGTEGSINTSSFDVDPRIIMAKAAKAQRVPVKKFRTISQTMKTDAQVWICGCRCVALVVVSFSATCAIHMLHIHSYAGALV